MAGVVLQPGTSANPYVNNTAIDGGAGDGIYGQTGAVWQVVNDAAISGNIGVHLAAGGSLTQSSSGQIVGTTAGVEISGGRVGSSGMTGGGQGGDGGGNAKCT